MKQDVFAPVIILPQGVFYVKPHPVKAFVDFLFDVWRIVLTALFGGRHARR